MIFTALTIIAQTIGGQPIENIPENPADVSLLTSTVLPLIFGILGALSLMYVVIGGFRYTISAGDPNNVQRARETIIYALIGLVVSVSAFTIINFVLENFQPSETGTGGLVGPNGILTNLTQVIARLTGAISVVMVLYGAFRFITSGGDSNAVKAGRETIIYALVGLVIAISAQGIVTFILEQL